MQCPSLHLAPCCSVCFGEKRRSSVVTTSVMLRCPVSHLHSSRRHRQPHARSARLSRSMTPTVISVFRLVVCLLCCLSCCRVASGVTLVGPPVTTDVSPLITDGGSSLSVAQCDLTIQGVGYVLLNLLDANNAVQSTVYQFISSPSQPSTQLCGLTSAVNVRYVTAVSLSGPLIVSSIGLWGSQLVSTSITQVQPDLVYWFDPSAMVNVSGTIPTSLAPITSYSVTVFADNSPVASASLVNQGSAWSVTLSNVPVLASSVTVTSRSTMPSPFPLALVATTTQAIPSLACPPGYSGSASGECSPCSPGSFSSGWTAADLCNPCPMDTFTSSPGSSFCFQSIAWWSFDLGYDVTDSGSGYATTYNGSYVGHLFTSTTQSAFGGGSLQSDGASNAFLAVEAFDFFCSETMNCYTHVQTSWSISLWFHPTAVNTVHSLISDWSSTARRYLGQINAQQGFDWLMTAAPDGVTAYGGLSTSPVVALNTWTHLVLTWNQFYSPTQAQVSLWSNATLVTSALWSSITNITYQGGNYTTLGYNQQSNVGFQGYMDEVRLFDGALNSDQVNLLYTTNMQPSTSEQTTLDTARRDNTLVFTRETLAKYAMERQIFAPSAVVVVE